MTTLDELEIILDGTSSALLELIVEYTAQLDEYERLSATYIMSCVGYAGVVFGVIATLLVNKKTHDNKVKKVIGAVAPICHKYNKSRKILCVFNINKNKFQNVSLNCAISLLLMTIPLIMVLYMYTFAMHCRKVAMYRAYLSYLEDELNQFIDTKLFFNRQIIPEFMLSKRWPSEVYDSYANSYGPYVMCVCLALILVVAFCLSFVFITRLPNKYRIPLIILWFFVVIFTVFSIWQFSQDLINNGSAGGKIFERCVEIKKGH